MSGSLNSPSELFQVLLFAGLLALGVWLSVLWNQMRRLKRQEERVLHESERHVQMQLASLGEKLSGELARRRRDAEQAEHSLETAYRRRLDELQALIASLRQLQVSLQARPGAAPSPVTAGEQAGEPGTTEARGGLSVVARAAKSGN